MSPEEEERAAIYRASLEGDHPSRLLVRFTVLALVRHAEGSVRSDIKLARFREWWRSPAGPESWARFNVADDRYTDKALELLGLKRAGRNHKSSPSRMVAARR